MYMRERERVNLPESGTNVCELLGSDVIGVHDEARGVVIKKIIELLEVLDFLFFLYHFVFVLILRRI